MKYFSISPIEMVSSFWCNRSLVSSLVKREVIGRYRGTLMGVLWSFITPVFMLGVYTFVFSYIFKARWDSGNESKVEFALVLFAGLIVFNIFSDCINRAPTLIASNVNYVKKVVFPLEILPWVVMGSALFNAALSLLVWLIAYVIFFGVPSLSFLFLPLVLVPLVFFVMGLSWFLASLGVFLRDITQVIGIMVTTMMFLSPIFYPVTAIPEEFQVVLLLNPLTPVIEQARGVIYWGKMPDYLLLCGYTLAAFVTSWLGFAWFQITRKGFADVL